MSAITTTDLNMWQRRTAAELLAIIDGGLKAARHPLDWTITSNGQLRGSVSKFDQLSEPDRRGIFEEWAHVLDAEPPRKYQRPDGGLRLTATFKRPTPQGDVTGFIQVELDGA